MPDDIWAQSVSCLEQGNLLDAYLAHLDCTPTQTRLRDELGRYRVWCSSTKACETGIMSLDHHSGRSRSCLVQFLGQLIINITDANAIIKGERLPLDELEFSDSDASDISLSNAYDESTELEQIVDDIAGLITSLFDLSRSLSSANARKLMIDASIVDMQHFKFSDRLEVQLQFPRASREIIERLVVANNKRRQIFKYLEEHRTATSGTLLDSYSSTAQREMLQSAARTLSSNSIDECGQVHTDEHFPLPVIPNQVPDGVPFTCPYCHEALHVTNVTSWRLHVMEDLKPYVCTYEHCEYPLDLFSDEYQWIQHEKLHRRAWTCAHCHDFFHSTASLRDHLIAEHDDIVDDPTIDLCESSALLYDTIECPMCAAPTSNFRKHVAQHLWAVALNTLPLPQDSALSGVGTDSFNDSEPEDIESQTSDVAMLEPEQDLTEVEVSKVEQPGSTHTNRTMTELEDKLTEGDNPDAEQPDLLEGSPVVTQSFVEAAARGDLTTVRAVYAEYSKIFQFRAGVNEALSAASKRGHAGVVSFLLQLSHVDANSWNNDYLRTSLARVADGGHSRFVQVLLDQPQVDIEARDHDGLTPLHLVAAHGDSIVVKILIDRGANIEARDENHTTPLSRAAAAGNLDVVNILIDSGADVNRDHRSGKTPLHYSATNGHAKVVQTLLKAGADVNRVDFFDATPLHCSAMRGHERVVQILLEAGADVDRVDLKGMTLLHYAAMHGHATVVQALIRVGTDVNAENQDGWKALHFAAQGGHTETVCLLLQAQGEDFKYEPDDYESLMTQLEAIGHGQIVDLLEEARARSTPDAAPSSQAAPQSGLPAGSSDFMDTNVDISGEPKTKATGSKKAKQDSRLEDHQSKAL